jgi:hypothetical protein
LCLQVAIDERSLPSLIAAVNAAAEIGFITLQLAQEIVIAKELIHIIKIEELDISLIHNISVATPEAFEGLAAAVERAQGS